MKYLPENGVSMVELLVAAAAISILALLIANLAPSISAINHNRYVSLSRDIASREMETLRKQPYANLSTGSATFSDSGLNQLPESSASYTIEDCPLEICISSERLKKIRVNVSWKDTIDNQSTELTTLIGEGGLGQ